MCRLGCGVVGVVVEWGGVGWGGWGSAGCDRVGLG